MPVLHIQIKDQLEPGETGNSGADNNGSDEKKKNNKGGKWNVWSEQLVCKRWPTATGYRDANTEPQQEIEKSSVKTQSILSPTDTGPHDSAPAEYRRHICRFICYT